MDLSKILSNTNPDDVRFLLQQYNINDEPSIEAIAKAIHLYGDDFITDLYLIVNFSSNAEGNYGPSLPEGSFSTEDFKKNTGMDWSSVGSKKGIDWSILGKGLSSFASKLKEGIGNYAASKYAFSNQQQQQSQPVESNNTWKWALGIGGGIIILLILFIVLRKKS